MSATNLPFLPGYRIETQAKPRHHKTNVFKCQDGIRVENNREAKLVDQRVFPGGTVDPRNLVISRSTQEYQEAVDGKLASPQATMSRLPAWVAYDRKVLRFFAYFLEAVASSSMETQRVRKCVVYFYLEDDSVHIAEPKIENSGIPQGVFIKRHRIPKSNNEFVTVEDLHIGTELAIYGRVFRLIDCDEFTRKFFDAQGRPLGPPEKYPIDQFTKKHLYQADTHNKLMNPLKNFMEASLGKPMGQEVEATQKFLKNDGRVLRFYCTWDDSQMFGEKRPYILHYFLADDTVEVLEIAQPNSGRDPFPALLKRQKLPRSYSDTTPDIPKIGFKGDHRTVYYSEEDFKIGSHVNVYGRNLLVCGCDAFTQEFYIANFHMRPEDFPRIQMDDPKEALPKMAPPEYNGFGSEEDSLASFLYLMPKVPKRDFKKLMENDGLKMRFMAQLVNPKPEDKERRFIVTYFLNDDTLSIFEKFDRNSGFVGGKFLERMRVKNPETSEYYKAGDFRNGSVLNINKYLFQLIEADDFTTNFSANNQAMFEQADQYRMHPGGIAPQSQQQTQAYGGQQQTQAYGGQQQSQSPYPQQQQGYGSQSPYPSQPPQNYGQPQQNYGQPQQNYGQPQQNYGQPQQNYGQPQQNYGQQYGGDENEASF